MDYFGARYYGSAQGRFSSPDPLNPLLSRRNNEEAELFFLHYIAEPAHWNKYSYALNNPLRHVDSDGRFPQDLTIRNMTTSLARYASTSTIAQQLAVKITRTALDWVFGSSPEVRPGGLESHEVAFAKETSAFTKSTFVGVPNREEPGFDGILTAPSSITDVRGVASLTETRRDNPRVLIDLAQGKESSAQKAGLQNVDLFIKATGLDSQTVVEYINRGPAITNVASVGTIRSVSIFTNDKKVVKVEGQNVTVCDQNGTCQ